MELDTIAKELLYSKSVIVSRDVNALLKLGYTLTRLALKANLKVTIVDERGVASRYIPFELLDKVRINNQLSDTCRGVEEQEVRIVILPGNTKILKHCRSGRVIVLVNSLRLVETPGYTKFYLTRIRGQPVFYLRSPDKGINTRMRFMDDYSIVVVSPTGDLGRAYELIKNYLATYGEITVKDAIVAISKELSLDKKKARSLIVDLGRRGYIRIHKKRIELL
ncbi:MAG: hypothetical protein QXE81_06045 [Desulfurococcaceae archaeon]